MVARESVPDVRITASPAQAQDLVFDEIRALLLRGQRSLLGLATGATYAGLFPRLQAEFAAGRLPIEALLATHLDEYLGFPPERKGGMVHELETGCPVLAERRRAGMFLPVPHEGSETALRAHEQRLQRAGGVHLQLLGIGRNGHLAFNEPGTPFELGFHITTLAATTRDDAKPRFLPEEPPLQACTAGLATILLARRVILCAFGKAKAPAVAAMLEGEVTTACPASVLRRHGNALVLLDREAASELGRAARV